MSQTFVGDAQVAVTKVEVGPCVVTQIKTEDTDGYVSVQLGFGTKSIKNVTKPMQGHLKGALTTHSETKVTAPRYLREVRVSDTEDLKVGSIINLTDVFAVGDTIAVTGISKGKGFQGVVKRWGFSGARRTHGQHGQARKGGSIGQGTSPGRVRKGKKMPGRMGSDTITISNLRITAVDSETNTILVSGSIPGHRGTNLIVRKIASSKEVVAENAPQAENENE